MASTTAKIAEPISGDSLYQERARRALPILVRQAEASQPLTYSDIAEELGMSNPRNLNYPLGSIGQTLLNLSKSWKENIPPIQCLVVNKNTGIPGEGVGWFLKRWGDFALLPPVEQRKIVTAEHSLIFAYPRWKEVLDILSLDSIKPDFAEAVQKAGAFQGGGESERHRGLKEYVARNPTCIGLHKATPAGENEVPLPSGDCLDVSFRSGEQWVAAEVKTTLSGKTDIIRGLFQCVKYRAVMDAVQIVEGKTRDARTVLVLEGDLPPDLLMLRHLLGVDVREGIVAKLDGL